jgi:ectoine hydroxylase-related dioxygenase (phytanoyl-CoA dioxygenase family)
MTVESRLEGTLDHYRDQGYAIFREVLDPELLAEASDHVAWLLEQNPGVGPENLGHRLLGKDPFWLRLVADPRLLDIAELFIGPHIALFASHYISKPAGTGRPVIWHQDGSYWPLEPMEVVTLWLAIDDSTPENGCMRVIPQTHHSEIAELVAREDIPNVLGSGMAEDLVEEEKAVDIVLKAGDVSVHHPNIIHGSKANTSDRRRCGLTIRYIPTSTRITAKDPWPSSFLLRGEPVPGINRYLERPKYVEGKHMPFRGCDTWK